MQPTLFTDRSELQRQEEVKKKLQLEESWKRVLSDEFEKPYFHELRAFVREEIESGKKIYPPPNKIFNAFAHCSFEKLKVVILGQDPYHGKGQAHGLCFSVNKGVRVPPSLQNIFQELRDDLGIEIPSHGNLESWADQGVLLLNATLTVRAGQPTSHSGKGWETFTDRVIEEINHRKEHVVFLLWGKYAQSKGAIIDRTKHYVLTASHPSPYSARSGFFGCKHFSQTNEILRKLGEPPINWQL